MTSRTRLAPSAAAGIARTPARAPAPAFAFALALALVFALALAAPTALAQDNATGPGGNPQGKDLNAPPEESNGVLILFLLVVSILVAAVAGFFVGTLSSRPHTGSLQNSLATNRPRVQQTALRLKGVSGKIAQNDRVRDLSGTLLVMSTSLTNVANDLNRLEGGLKKRGGAR